VTSREKQSARAVARSHWLSELAQAIDEAQCVAWRLGVVEGRSNEARDLYVRLESARAEVDALRRRTGVTPTRSDVPDDLCKPVRDPFTPLNRNPD
jgi:hypothetical protein